MNKFQDENYFSEIYYNLVFNLAVEKLQKFKFQVENY